jgi:hypothetical protein
MRKSKAHWTNSTALLENVDKLPRGPEWKYHTFNVKHPTKENCEEEVEIFFRDPLDVIKEILGNPEFNNPEIMSYEPAKVYVGPEGCSDEMLTREYGEMHTGDWWNRLQVCTSAIVLHTFFESVC